MTSPKYCIRLSKIVLRFGRALGITFGGLQITPLSNNFLNHGIYSHFKISIIKKWKLFGILVFPFYLAFSISRLVFVVNRFKQQTMDLIIKSVFAAGSTLYVLHCCGIYVICHFFGKEIFEFLSRQKLSKKQSRVCLLVLALPVVYIFVIDVMDLIESAVKYNSIVNRLKFCTEIFLFDIVWALAIIIRTLVSLMTFWNIKNMTTSISPKLISRSNLDTTLIRICKKYKNLNNSFERFDSIFAFLNLTNFSMIIAFILMGLPEILRKGDVAYISELSFNIAILVALCWVHGLPHQACKGLINALDDLALEMPPNAGIQQTYSILSRETIGFKQMGYNYELGLLPSVSVMFIIFLNFFFGFNNVFLLLFRYLFFCSPTQF